jgi:hypothetical protein
MDVGAAPGGKDEGPGLTEQTGEGRDWWGRRRGERHGLRPVVEKKRMRGNGASGLVGSGE